MDKNTIWAIVLSTLVIIGSYFLLPKVFGKKNVDVENQTAVEVVAEDNVNDQANQEGILSDTLFDEETSALLAEAEESEEDLVPAKEEKTKTRPSRK